MADTKEPPLNSGTWERLRDAKPKLLRMKVPGGWLVTVEGGYSYPISVYPDPEHQWAPRIKR